MGVILKVSKRMCLSLNNKKLSELSDNLQKVVKTVMSNIEKDDEIKCVVRNTSKVVLIIEVKGNKKIIQIIKNKIQRRDRIFELIKFLKSINVKNEVLKDILSYHYANIDKNIFGEQLHEHFSFEIKRVEEEFKDKSKMFKVIEYLFFNTSDLKSDYFYLGDDRYGNIYSCGELYEKILSHKDNYRHPFMRIGPFNVLPISRLNGSLKNEIMFKLNLTPIIKK